jgi:hypothetical protein
MREHVRTPYICLAGLLLATLGAPARAAEVDLSVNADAARLAVGVPIGNNLLVDGSWLYHSDHGYVVSAAGHVTGAASGADPLWAGVGLRLSYVNNDRGSQEDGVALGMGGFLRYTLPQYDRISFGGALYFAPGVLSFGDVDKLYDVEVWAGYSVIKDADVYLGWRKVEADFNDDGSKSMDSGLHIGLRARF